LRTRWTASLASFSSSLNLKAYLFAYSPSPLMGISANLNKAWERMVFH
jgi:hypothetical protein